MLIIKKSSEGFKFFIILLDFLCDELIRTGIQYPLRILITREKISRVICLKLFYFIVIPL
jgi:hypothetical protein